VRRPCALLVLAGCAFTREAPPIEADDEPGTPDAEAPRLCTAYTTKYGGHSYRLTDRALAWSEAETDCARDGGHLLKIESHEEDTATAEMVFLVPSMVWIGLHDASQNGLYVWSDGAEPLYRNFNGTPPGPTSPDCIEKSTYDLDGHWYSVACTSTLNALCECDLP